MQIEQPKKLSACLNAVLIPSSTGNATRLNLVVQQGKSAAASAPSAALTGDDSAASAASTASAASAAADDLRGIA